MLHRPQIREAGSGDLVAVRLAQVFALLSAACGMMAVFEPDLPFVPLGIYAVTSTRVLSTTLRM
jgi:hypothetical protein